MGSVVWAPMKTRAVCMNPCHVSKNDTRVHGPSTWTRLVVKKHSVWTNKQLGYCRGTAQRIAFSALRLTCWKQMWTLSVMNLRWSNWVDNLTVGLLATVVLTFCTKCTGALGDIKNDQVVYYIVGSALFPLSYGQFVPIIKQAMISLPSETHSYRSVTANC